MAVADLHRDPSRLIFRYGVELASILYAALVLQLTLVPFDFLPGFGPGGGLYHVGANELSKPNVISNLALFAPFGIFVFWSFVKRNPRVMSSYVKVAGLALLLSLLAEFLQAFSPSRVSSLTDVGLNVVGALLGGALSASVRNRLPRVIAKLICLFQRQPRTATVQVYLTVLLFAAAMPFTFAIDVGRLNRCFKQSTFTMYGEAAAHAEMGTHALAAGDVLGYQIQEQLRQRLPAMWSAECISFAVLAWLALPALRREYRFRFSGAVFMLVWMGIAYAILLSVMQAFVVARGFHLTAIVMRVIGLLLGVATYGVFAHEQGQDTAMPSERQFRRLASIGFFSTCVFIVYTGIIPFLPAGIDAAGGVSVGGMELMPLASYFQAPFDRMVDDVSGKAFSFALFGFLLVSWRHEWSAINLTPRMITAAKRAMGLAVAIELAQLYLPSRISSASDIVIAAVFSAVGVFLQEQSVRFYRFCRSEHAVRDDLIEVAGRMGMLDTLLSKLCDVYPAAPAEPSLDADRSPDGKQRRAQETTLSSGRQ